MQEGKLTIIAEPDSGITAAEIAAKTGHKEEDIVIVPNDKNRKGILGMGAVTRMLAAASVLSGATYEPTVKKALYNINPHNFPLFQINGYKIYAYNEAAANRKYAKIIKNKSKW